MACFEQPQDVSAEVNHILQKLREGRLRVTSQRTALVKALVQQAGPFTADELHQQVVRQGIDLVTVYRSLSTFADLEIIHPVDFNDGTQRFEYSGSDPLDHHHHHIVCKSCKKAEPVEICGLKKHEQALEQRGFSNISHRLEFFGLCRECRP
jgi:Fur family ferric uptake transcriptional regulator